MFLLLLCFFYEVRFSLYPLIRDLTSLLFLYTDSTNKRINAIHYFALPIFLLISYDYTVPNSVSTAATKI